MKTLSYIVEIRASDCTWFTAIDANGIEITPMPAKIADNLVLKLREQGFQVRARCDTKES